MNSTFVTFSLPLIRFTHHLNRSLLELLGASDRPKLQVEGLAAQPANVEVVRRQITLNSHK